MNIPSLNPAYIMVLDGDRVLDLVKEGPAPFWEHDHRRADERADGVYQEFDYVFGYDYQKPVAISKGRIICPTVALKRRGNRPGPMFLSEFA